MPYLTDQEGFSPFWGVFLLGRGVNLSNIVNVTLSKDAETKASNPKTALIKKLENSFLHFFVPGFCSVTVSLIS